MKKHVGELRERLVWASVEEKETELEALMERDERLNIKIRKVEEKLAETKELEERHEVTITDLEKRISEGTERDAPLHAEIKELKEIEKVHFAEIKKYRLEESALNEQYKRIKAQLKDVNNRIEAENRKDGNEGKRRALADQRKLAEEQRKGLEQEQVNHRDLISDLDGKIADIDRKASELQARQETLRSAVADAEGMMRNLRNSQQSKLTAYGHNIPALLTAIDRETRWKKKPIGPIGNHLKLRNKDWAGVLESVMGNTLNAFCVTNIYDRKN
jgi:chromosome segregation ATPase